MTFWNNFLRVTETLRERDSLQFEVNFEEEVPLFHLLKCLPRMSHRVPFVPFKLKPGGKSEERVWNEEYGFFFPSTLQQ